MARDTKKPRGGNKNGGSLLTGLLVGLIIGVVAAVGVALYVNRSANPFGNKAASTPATSPTPAPASGVPVTEILHPEGSAEDASAIEASAAAHKASGVDRFDFYTMLPAVTDKGGKEIKPAESKASVASAPAKLEPVTQSWLQVGSFQNEHDADNLKARLALIGIQARIQTQDIPGKGLWHRVRIGPFTRTADMDKARVQLRGNGIDSNVVKGD